MIDRKELIEERFLRDAIRKAIIAVKQQKLNERSSSRCRN